jgi:hypothetical protein
MQSCGQPCRRSHTLSRQLAVRDMGPSCTDLCYRDSELVAGGITMRGHEACVGDVNENGIDGK